MRQVDIQEAKTQLSRLVDEVVHGEEIIIAKAGKPLARLVGIARQPRRRGALKGQIQIAADFDAPLPEQMLADFEGNA